MWDRDERVALRNIPHPSADIQQPWDLNRRHTITNGDAEPVSRDVFRVDGREQLSAEIQAVETDARSYIVGEFKSLLASAHGRSPSPSASRSRQSSMHYASAEAFEHDRRVLEPVGGLSIPIPTIKTVVSPGGAPLSPRVGPRGSPQRTRLLRTWGLMRIRRQTKSNPVWRWLRRTACPAPSHALFVPFLSPFRPFLSAALLVKNKNSRKRRERDKQC